MVAWLRPGVCRLTRAGVGAASTRRCMRKTRRRLLLLSAPNHDPQRQATLPRSPDRGITVASGRGGGGAAPQPLPPGLRLLGRIGLPSGPQRRAPRLRPRPPPLAPRLVPGPQPSPAPASGPSGAARGEAPASAAGVERCRGGSESPGLRQPRGARAHLHAARDAASLRARGRPALQVGELGPAVAVPPQFLPAGRERSAPAGRAAPLRTRPPPSRRCPRRRRGKVYARRRPGRPAGSPPRLPGHAARGWGAPRGGVREERGRRSSHPSPHLLAPLPGRAPPGLTLRAGPGHLAVGDGTSSSSSATAAAAACSTACARRLAGAEAGAALRPHAAGANLPSVPGPSAPGPRAAASPRLRSAPPRGRALPRCRRPAPPAHSRARSHLSEAPHAVPGLEERASAEALR